jgi:hypothetical protein
MASIDLINNIIFERRIQMWVHKTFLIVAGCTLISFSLGVIGSSAVANQPSWVSQGTDKGVGVYRNPEYGKLTFRVPAEWKSMFERDAEKNTETIIFTPLSRNSFKLMVSPLVSKGERIDFQNQDVAKKQVEQLGSRLLSGATESELRIAEVKGKYSTGYYFLLTDKAPKPGEWKYLVQGRIGVGMYLLHFTILTHTSNATEILQSIKMLSTAEYQKE